MAEFYRVEKNGKGPYAGRNSVVQYLADSGVISGSNFPPGYYDARPTPSCDDRLSGKWEAIESDARKDYIFGFSSFGAVFSWFNLPEEIEFFKKYGFSIVKYETCDMIEGSRQAIARKDGLTKKEEIAF